MPVEIPHDYNHFPAWCHRCKAVKPPGHGRKSEGAGCCCVAGDQVAMEVRDELHIEARAGTAATEHTTAADAIGDGTFTVLGSATGRYTPDPIDLPDGAQAVIDPATGFTKIRRKHPPVMSGSHRVGPNGRLQVRTLNGDWAEIETGGPGPVCPTLVEMPTLNAGDTVYEKITGRGPYVLIERAEVEIESETPSRRPGETRLASVWVATWMVRDRGGNYLSVPEAVLTREVPTPSRARRLAGVTAVVLRAALRAAFCAVVFPAWLAVRLWRRQRERSTLRRDRLGRVIPGPRPPPPPPPPPPPACTCYQCRRTHCD